MIQLLCMCVYVYVCVCVCVWGRECECVYAPWHGHNWRSLLNLDSFAVSRWQRGDFSRATKLLPRPPSCDISPLPPPPPPPPAPPAMSKSLKKRKHHWTNKVRESVLCRNGEGELGLELKGGAENGQFPVVGELLPGGAPSNSGQLFQDELLLEVNDTPVAGLTTRDVHAVVKHSKDPVRLKCVKQGNFSLFSPAFRSFLSSTVS